MADIISEKYGDGITTDYIFDETVSVTMRKANKSNALEVGKFLLNSEIGLFEINNLIFRRAWVLFQNTNNLSFTDCTCIAFMSIFGIIRIATFDKEFKNIKDIEVIEQ